MTYQKEARGTLIPIGGNEDKGASEQNGHEYITDSILSHVVKESGGKEAKIIIILTATGYPKSVGKKYAKAFEALGCSDVSLLNLTESLQCDLHDTLEMILPAKCIMFTGGDQSKISSVLEGTRLHELLLDKFFNESFVIAGTSAGAMAMAQEMIAGGSSTESLIKGAVDMSTGLGLIPELIIDTHFIRRGRFGRLVEAVAIYPNLIGIGLAEDTALIIKKNNNFKVIGSGMVVILDASHLAHNAHGQLRAGTPMSISNLTTHILANGDQFLIKDKKITILPIHEEFV